MSATVQVLTYVGSPTLVLAADRVAIRPSREVRLHRAESVALKKGDNDPQGRAGLAIIESLTRREREPWYLAILPGRKPGTGQDPEA